MESNTNDKNTTSEEVRKILFQKGFSFLFNYQDFRRYKKQCRNAFNKAHSIADKFLSNADQSGDFSNYLF